MQSFINLSKKLENASHLMKIALDSNVVSQLVFRKLIQTIIDHLSDEDRPVAIESFKCAIQIFNIPEVSKLLLVSIDDFLRAILAIMAAKKTLVQSKDLFLAILNATNSSKVAEKLIKAMQAYLASDASNTDSILSVTAALLSLLADHSMTFTVYVGCL